MTGNAVAVFLPALVLLLALVAGPLPIPIRGVMRPVLGPQRTRKWYSLAAFGVGAGMVGAVVIAGLSGADLALSAALLGLLVLLAVTDWQWRWLPVEWTLGVAALAVIFAVRSGDPMQVFLQMAVPAVTLLAIRQTLLWALQKEAMGLGDICLIAGLGGFLHPFESFLLIGIAALSGLGELGIRRLFQGKTARDRAVAYGTHLCIIFVILRNLTPNW